jgi:ACS family hexuronate transporter-like MFS transporter
MFASTVLNYMDRQAIAVVGERITGEFRIKFEDLGWIIAAFQITYALFQVPAGYLVDRLNVRWTYAGAVLWWSVAAIAVALAPTLGLLMVARAVLGFGEAFNWPCALRVTSLALPPADRGLGNGIFNSGAAVGAVITPLVVTPLTVLYGWRVAFAAIGAVGFVWVVVWLALTGGPRRGLFITSEAAAQRDGVEARSGRPRGLPAGAWAAFGILHLVAAGIVLAKWDAWRLSAVWVGVATLMIGLLVVASVLPMRWLEGADWARSLGEIVRRRRFWVLVAVSVSVNVCWHFLVNWLPTYLKTDRGMAFITGSLLSALPFLAADVGNLGGGWLSRWLARDRGLPPERARRAVLIGCVALISTGALVGRVQGDALTLLLLGTMALGTAAFMANYFAYCQEVDARHTGLIVGILGGLGNLFAAGFAPIAGRIKDQTGTFGPVFLIVGLLPFLGLAAILLAWGRADEGGAAGTPKPAGADADLA